MRRRLRGLPCRRDHRGVYVSSLSVIGPDSTPGVAAASIFTDHSALGYVVVAVISLCLGAFLTVFCFRIKKHNDDDGGEDKNDDRKH